MNFFDHKDLGNHLLQYCPKVIKHPVEIAVLTLVYKIHRVSTYEMRCDVST